MEGEIVAIYEVEEQTSILIKDDSGKLNRFNIKDIPIENAIVILTDERVRIGTTNRDINIDDITIIEEGVVTSTSTEETTLQEH